MMNFFFLLSLCAGLNLSGFDWTFLDEKIKKEAKSFIIGNSSGLMQITEQKSMDFYVLEWNILSFLFIFMSLQNNTY